MAVPCVAWARQIVGLGLGLALLVRVAGASRAALRAAETVSSWVSSGDVDPFTKPSFLIMSSPMERKVSYVQMENFKAKGLTHPLVDSGLESPRGIAYDRKRSVLYVADISARKILRYKIRVRNCATLVGSDDCSTDKLLSHALVIDGSQLSIVEDTLCAWVFVDTDGNLFFTDEEKGTINRLEFATIKRIDEGVLEAAGMKTVSASEVSAMAAAQAGEETSGDQALGEGKSAEAKTSSALKDSIIALYDTSSNVNMPAGVLSDGLDLFWTNSAGAIAKGALVKGPADPAGSDGNSPEASTGGSVAMASNTDKAYGVALTYNAVVYTADGGSLYALGHGSSAPVTLANGFDSPKGIVWDGDNTLFVADEAADSVYSLPCGRLGPGAPLSVATSLRGPFGIALLKGSDPAFIAAGLTDVELEAATLAKAQKAKSTAAPRTVASFLLAALAVLAARA